MASEQLTQMLVQAAAGDRAAVDALLPLVYGELKSLAAARLRAERPGHTLQATALVHEAYLKLIDQRSVTWQSRAHFFGVAAQMMRRILLDYARARSRLKRGGNLSPGTLDENIAVSADRVEELLAIDEALSRLEQLDPRQARVVELRFFGGMSVEETAEVMGISEPTVKREWAMARAWLYRELGPS